MASAFRRGRTATATPNCRGAAAWKTAVDSGVPADAIAKLYFDRDHPIRGEATHIEWSFRVEGHDEYRREIDATTCALRRAWGASGSPVRSSPRGASPGKIEPPPAPKASPDAAGF
jgi:hypothetical protein